MNCCQCQGIDELFSDQFVSDELSRFRKKGPDKTTRILIDALRNEGVQGLTLLDIGGGLGAIQYELLGDGARNAMDVDASQAYIRAAQEEGKRRGVADRIRYQHGNFIDVADQIPTYDIVTLDRVLCCYPDMEKLVDLSAGRAGKLYGLVYPRDTWWAKIGLMALNFIFRLQKMHYRTYMHPTRSVEALINKHGLKRRFYGQTFIWQMVVYAR